MKPRKPIRKVSAKQRAKQANLNKIRIRRWNERSGFLKCHICHAPIWYFDEYVLDHDRPRGMGGGKRDDSESNLKDSHFICNSLKGSKRNFSLDNQ